MQQLDPETLYNKRVSYQSSHVPYSTLHKLKHCTSCRIRRSRGSVRQETPGLGRVSPRDVLEVCISCRIRRHRSSVRQESAGSGRASSKSPRRSRNLHKLQDPTAPRWCTSRERGFRSSKSPWRSRSLHKRQHVSLHQLQQGHHRVVLARKAEAELCKLGVCLQQRLQKKYINFSPCLHVYR